jgi:hypothetical protein
LWRWDQYFAGRTSEVALIGIGLVAAIWRLARTRRLDPLFGGLLVAFFVFVFLISSKSEFYMILFFPMLVLLLATTIADVGANLSGSRVVAVALLVILAVAGMGFEDNFRDIVEAASDFQDRDYANLSMQLQTEIPPGSRVVAPPIYWIGLSQPPYYLDYVDFYVWERIRRERNMTWPEFLRDIHPDYVVLDAKAKYEAGRGTPRFMEDNASLIAQIRHVNYGRVEVWRMRGAAQ